MMKKIFGSFLLALQNIRSNFFHTLLSILGIVIGVAALVIILSMIDGMEDYAQKQISSTTSLKTIEIRTNTHRMVNGIRLPKDTFAVIDYSLFEKMEDQFSSRSTFYVISSLTKEIRVTGSDSVRAAVMNGVSASVLNRSYLSAGVRFDSIGVREKAQVVLINQMSANLFQPDSLRWKELLGDTLRYDHHELVIKGVIKSRSTHPEVYVPFTLLSAADLRTSPPLCYAEARSIQEVAGLKEEFGKWLNKQVRQTDNFTVSSNEFRLQQAAKGFFLFRIVMGLIVGVAVLVGGIGVMNVLLISVTERTAEIGVRKAVGANRRDIMMQFLAESVTVSVFGSLMGLALGVLATMAIVPIIKIITEVPFYAAYTWNTFFVVSTVAILIGVAFGTYPALRASRLDPVEAIRHV